MMNISNPVELPQNIEEAIKLTTHGTKQMFQGDFLDAISTFEKVLELHPASLFAFQYRAICKHHLLMNTDNISGEEQANGMRDVISDLENALNIARGMRNFLSLNS